MYPTYELALQRQAEIRAAAAHQRMVREARSGSLAARPRTVTARTQPLRLMAALARLAGA